MHLLCFMFDITMRLFLVITLSIAWMCGGNAVAVERAAVQKKVSKVSMPEIGPARYIIGGILGTILGFGIGHTMQGRWLDDYGWVFTAGSTVTGLGAFLGKNCGIPVDKGEMHLRLNENYDACLAEKKRRQRPWVVGFWLVRAIETVSVWLPRDLSFKLSNPSFAGSTTTDIPMEDYVLGGVFGTFIGFGTGHSVQGRWQRDGQIYTYTQLVGLAPTVYGFFCLVSSSSGPDRIDDESPRRSYPLCDSFPVLIGLGGATFLISRLVEVVSVWGPSIFRYRVVMPRSKSPLSIIPLLSKGQAGLQLALAF